MAKEDIKEFIRKRPPIFWWVLANLLAGAFAVISWTTCLYIFNYPERPSNYEILRKLNRITPVTEFTPADCPDGDPADPKIAFKKFFPLKDKRVKALNLAQKRNYLTNYQDPSPLTYVEGDYIVSDIQQLSETDFFSPGLAVRAQATVQTEERDEAAAYPVVIELLLPTAETPTNNFYKKGDTITLARATHRAVVLAVTKLGTPEEPLICLTVVPLSYGHYLATDGTPLPLSPPDPLNVEAPIPVMPINRPK